MPSARGTSYSMVHRGEVDGVVRDVKLCRKCGQTRVAEVGASDSGFSIGKRIRQPDGTVRLYLNSSCNACLRAQRRTRAALRPVAPPPAPANFDRACPRLPSGPFVAWLRAYMARIGVDTAGAVAPLVHLNARTVQRYLNTGQPWVLLDYVDRALIAADRPVTVDGRMVERLDDLYPYEEQEAA